MIEASVVADCVVHPYNLADDNCNRAAQAQLDAVDAAHVMATGDAHPEHVLTHDELGAKPMNGS